jgi:bacterioferritin-associated ferredoxin
VPANRSRIDKRTAAIVAAIVLLATVAAVAVLVLTGGSEPKTPAAEVESPPVNAVVEHETPEPAKPDEAPNVDAQVKTLDGLMRLSEKGRAAAVNGDIKTATANRATLLRDLKRLDAQATDKQLKAAVASFIPAITEALRQNRECGSKCSTADLNRVARLKQTALNKVNPLLKAHGGDTYRLKDI